MTLDLKAGVYKGRVVAGSEQYGESTNNNPELIIDMNLRLDDAGNMRRVSTALYFSPDAAQYSFDRLRACGWQGQSPADLANLAGIDANEVDVEVRHENYNGEMKTKIQIMSGGGRFQTAKPVEKAAFAAKVAALMGQQTTGNGATTTAPKPNF